ncbi:hypothetical protein Sjap_002813 [Stephania japonica]|uniref:Uncharacterized protein n=1 Tax=Stephania japonica TaxID=461633 RepID=A0AAP0PSW9_9MAGN
MAILDQLEAPNLLLVSRPSNTHVNTLFKVNTHYTMSFGITRVHTCIHRSSLALGGLLVHECDNLRKDFNRINKEVARLKNQLFDSLVISLHVNRAVGVLMHIPSSLE